MFAKALLMSPPAIYVDGKRALINGPTESVTSNQCLSKSLSQPPSPSFVSTLSPPPSRKTSQPVAASPFLECSRVSRGTKGPRAPDCRRTCRRRARGPPSCMRSCSSATPSRRAAPIALATVSYAAGTELAAVEFAPHDGPSHASSRGRVLACWRSEHARTGQLDHAQGGEAGLLERAHRARVARLRIAHARGDRRSAKTAELVGLADRQVEAGVVGGEARTSR